MPDRLQQKYELVQKLGALFGPLQRLVEHPEQYNAQEKAETIARYCAEYPAVSTAFHAFSLGQPGHSYAIQNRHFVVALDHLVSRLAGGHELAKILPETLATARAAIEAIPIPPTSVILEAGDPFTAYGKLRELCEVDASISLTWLDPFLDASIFHRYLRDIRPDVPITLVTLEPDARAGNRDRQRWTAFLDVSRLYAAERGLAKYRLLVPARLHERWVVFDEKRIYSLGGSAKDAADTNYFTIASVNADAQT